MRPLAVVVLVLGLAAASGPTWGGEDFARGPVIAQAEGARPLGAVLRGIAQRYPGRALDAQLTEQRGRPVYRIKWLGDDGKVRDIVADARTGDILRMR